MRSITRGTPSELNSALSRLKLGLFFTLVGVINLVLVTLDLLPINISPVLITTLGFAASSCGLVMITVAILSINRNIITPLSQLSAAMRAISVTSNLSLRVPALTSNGLGEVVDSINQLLSATENAYLDMLQARYEVESANKGKSLFIAKVSHELRTPIHGITGMLRILSKQETAPGKRQYIQMAQDSANNLLETINEILDFSKMQNGELALERTRFNLLETIRSTVEHLIPRFEEKLELLFCCDIAPTVPEIAIGDPARLRNILVNLLGNAFKFADKGHVTLEVSSHESSKGAGFIGIRFKVIDTGIGIPSDKLSTIFDPFTTADEGTARLYAGTGLGLAIIKQIVEKLEGSIHVESTPGRGSIFSVDIPIEVPKESSVERVANSDIKRVAVLAPSDIRQTIVTRGFERFGVNVTVFSADDPAQLDQLALSTRDFQLIHIIKGYYTLMDEVHPIIRAANQSATPIVLAVPSSEISLRNQLAKHKEVYVTLQPTSARDVLLIATGRLSPTTSLRTLEEINEKSSTRLNILVADDARTNRIILQTLLEEAGHTVELVENGQQLLERITIKSSNLRAKAHDFDLVLTDIQMPVMDGITATLNFRDFERKTEPERKLPIIAVTSYAFPEECSKMLASGIDHILTKPINPKRLNQLLSQIACSSSYSSELEGSEDSDQELIDELCQLTANVTKRLSELKEELDLQRPESKGVIVDIQGVVERSGDSLKRTELILSVFIDSYQEPLTALAEHQLPTSDPKMLRRHIHSLKGLLLDAGAQTAASCAVSLEERSNQDPLSIAKADIDSLANATREAADVIKELVNALHSLEALSALPSISAELEMN